MSVRVKKGVIDMDKILEVAIKAAQEVYDEALFKVSIDMIKEVNPSIIEVEHKSRAEELQEILDFDIAEMYTPFEFIKTVNGEMYSKTELFEMYDEENELLKAENEVRENRAKADEKNRLYDRIAKEVEPRLRLIADILKNVKRDKIHPREAMAHICVVGSYIKRRGNLLLLGEENVVFVPENGG